MKSLIVAHRGSSKDAPENTMPAFKLAWEHGADAIEGDFRLTADGNIVCIHDKDTRRTSNAKLVVAKSTLTELKALDAGGYYSEAYKGIAIPTLAEVLETVPENKKIHIEIKCGTEIIPRLLEDIDGSKVTGDQIAVICFDSHTLKQFKASAPQYKVYWLCSFKKDVTGRTKPSDEMVLQTLNEIHADGLSSNASMPEPRIAKVKEAGYEWHVWTVNDINKARHMQSLGASSITTNMPGYFQQHLNK